jgi:hypothetical protein
MTQPGQPPPDERKTGLFLGGEMEISPPPELPPLAKPTTRQQTRAPSPARQLPVARGSSTRPTIRHEAPERGGPDDTTKIVAFIALGLAVLGVVALLLMSSRATPSPNVVERAPEKPATAPPPAPVVEPLRPLPQGTVTRPAPPPTTTTGQTKNLIANPGFEQVADGQATGWFTHNYNGAPEFTIAAGAGRRGGNAARVFSATGADAKWFQKIQVKPNTTYLMKAWARCENITGPGRGVQINMEPNDFRSDEIKGTTGWTLLQFTFETRDKTEVDVNCLYGGWGQSTGTAWFDDVEVIELFSGK